MLAVGYPVSILGQRGMRMEEVAADCASPCVQFRLNAVKRPDCRWSEGGRDLRSGGENCMSEVFCCFG